MSSTFLNSLPLPSDRGRLERIMLGSNASPSGLLERVVVPVSRIGLDCTSLGLFRTGVFDRLNVELLSQDDSVEERGRAGFEAAYRDASLRVLVGVNP